MSGTQEQLTPFLALGLDIIENHLTDEILTDSTSRIRISLQNHLRLSRVREVLEGVKNDATKSETLALLAQKGYRTLKDTNQRVIALRYGIDGENIKTLEELGREFGVTRERIRQRQKQALRTIQTRFRDEFNPLTQSFS